MSELNSPVSGLMRMIVATALSHAFTGSLHAQTASAHAPRDSVHTLYGAALRINRIGSHSQFAREDFAQAVANRDREYGTLDMHRMFYGIRGEEYELPDWADEKLIVGRPVHVSFKQPPAAIISGELDAYFRQWFAAAPDEIDIWWTFYHEPEENIEMGEFTAEEYRLAFQRLRNISKEEGIAKPNVKSALVLMDYTTRKRSGRNWEDYYPGTDHIDVIAWDVYNFNEKDNRTDNDESMAEHQIYAPSLAITRAAGKPYAIAELGYDNPKSRPAFLRDLGEWAKENEVLYIAYFDLVGYLGDHRMMDGPSQEAYQEINTRDDR